jgi:small subunit ribosomal protein S4
MPKLIKYRYKLYKRFELDVWGLLNNNPVFGHPVVRFFQDSYRHRAERAKQRFRQFIYRIDVINPDKMHKRKKWKFISMQLVRLFYRGVNQKKIFKFSKIASAVGGLWVDNFLMLIESRISTILYRINWIPNILFIKQFLSHGGVTVDFKVPLNSNFTVQSSSFIHLTSRALVQVRANLYYRLVNNMVYFNAPRYVFVNYKLMFASLYRNPKLVDLSFPVLLDIYRLNDLN